MSQILNLFMFQVNMLHKIVLPFNSQVQRLVKSLIFKPQMSQRLVRSFILADKFHSTSSPQNNQYYQNAGVNILQIQGKLFPVFKHYL